MPITEWADPAFKAISEQMRIPVEDVSTIFVGETYGALVELGLDMFTKKFMSKIVQGLLGLGLSVYSIFGEIKEPRLRKELLEWGTHHITRIVDPTPHEIAEIQDSIDTLIAGIEKGDMKLVAQALFRTPEEWQKALKFMTGKGEGEEKGEEEFGVFEVLDIYEPEEYEEKEKKIIPKGGV